VRSSDPRAEAFFRPDAYEGALQSLVYECAFGVRRVSRESGTGENGNCIGYVSDDSNKSSIYSEVYSDFKAKNPAVAPIMRNLTHLDDRKWPGLAGGGLAGEL
jgi:hypothetical protein